MGTPEIQVTPKDARRRQLAKMAKARLIALCRSGVTRPDGGRSIITGGMYPLEQWTKDDLVASIMAAEFPPEVTR
jgi:hypothetical protein